MFDDQVGAKCDEAIRDVEKQVFNCENLMIPPFHNISLRFAWQTKHSFAKDVVLDLICATCD